MRLGCAPRRVVDGSYYSLCCGFGSLLGSGSSASFGRERERCVSAGFAAVEYDSTESGRGAV